MIKKILCICSVFALIFTTCISVNATVLDEVMEERKLMNGVTYKNIRRLESYGWQDIYVVTADLKAPGVTLEVLKSEKGESYLENTLEMAQKNDAIAAINADFFASLRTESGRGSAVGVEIIDGELKSSASISESMNTLYKNFDSNAFYIDAFNFDITLTAQNGESDKIKLVNKYDDLKGIVMYTDDWAEKSVGSVGGIIEISVDKNGKVVEKVTESEPILIPKGGFVLSAHMAYNTFLLDYVNVGDVVSVSMKSTPDLEKIETAVGGGGVVLKEGIVQTEFSHNITGRNPRSAIGTDKSGTVITMVALDGRRGDAVGMTQTELGNLMKSLGCYTALNLDGGGSTLMATENDYGEKVVVNKPSDGGYRKVTNSIGIISTAEKDLPVKSIEIIAEENVFLNTSVKFDVYGYDKYGQRKTLDLSKAKYNSDGKVSGGKFYSNSSGTARLSVSLNGLKAEKTFNVLDIPREINFSETKITLGSNESYIPIITGKDSNGKMARINLSDTDVTVTGDAVAISGDEIIAKQKGASVVCAKFGDVTANIAIMVDGADEISIPDNIVIADTQNIHKDIYKDDGFRFTVFGNTREISNLYDLLLVNKSVYEMKENGKFQVFLGANVFTEQIEKACPDYVTAKNYNSFSYRDNTFITLPNVSGKIYTKDASVWTNFINDVNASYKNVFIFLDRNYITQNAAEMQAFKRIVEGEAAKGKNVYVFGGGFVNKNTVENGVRYINTAGIFPSIALEGTSHFYIKYVLVTVNGNDVTFEYKSVFGD